MAANAYRQPYRQGPPPRQQHYDDSYDQRNYGDQRQNQAYNQRSQEYDGHYEEQYDDNQDQPYYNQYDDHGRWDNSRDQGPHYQNQQYRRPQQHDYGHDQQRQYQFDNRYQMNSQERPFIPNPPGRHPPGAKGGGPLPQRDQPGAVPEGSPNYSSRGGGNNPPRGRERILQHDPESPKTAAWDNPFPAFPSKKKQQTEPKRLEPNGFGRSDNGNGPQSQDLQQPSTSHSNKQHTGAPPPLAELSRPHTSHSQRAPSETARNASSSPPTIPSIQDFPGPRPHTSHSQHTKEPFHSSASPPNMPIRQINAIRHLELDEQQSVPMNDNPPRPAPRRAMTGPAPSQPFNGQARSEGLYQRQPEPVSSMYDDYQSHHYMEEQNHSNPLPQSRRYDGEYRNDPQRQRQPTAQPPFDGHSRSHQRQSSDQSFGWQQPAGIQKSDSGSYRGVLSTKKTSLDMPNFDAIPNHDNEKSEVHMGQGVKPNAQVYHKPMYQDAISTDSVNRQQQVAGTAHNLVSDFTQFSFDLDANESLTPKQNFSQSPSYQDAQGRRQDPSTRVLPFRGPGQSIQHPQRSTSRPQDLPPDGRDNYGPGRPQQQIPPFRPGLAQRPSPGAHYENDAQGRSRERREYDNRRMQNEDHQRPPIPLTQASYHTDPSNPEHDQRIQPRPGFVSPQQGPPRPATSNSGRPGPMADNGSRSFSDNYQRTGIQKPDSLPAHPVPFRPGLMQPTPPGPRVAPPAAPLQPQPQPQIQTQPQPQQQTHQRVPSGAQPPKEPEPAVTISELNVLREDYKSHPNDYPLGLKFAKRLVEAATVLASENGRADPKQTAKNRERYIFDAHKIVKRLCSSNYPEAMFYLADCYGQGLLGLEPDPKEAFSLYQSAAKLGHPQSAYRVAVCCELGAEEGGGTRRDPLKAVQWYKRAATLGDAPAMYKMGMILLKGLLGQPKNPREAISWLKRAAERADTDNPHALHELGLLYENAQPSDIILRDETYALQLFQQAAELGYKYSQFRLGSAYEYGSLNLPIDPRMSIMWYSRAAKQGEHQSEFALSGWYLTGSGQAGPGEQPLLQQSDTEAYLWARKAASSGLAKAEYAMGYYTEVGIGVTSNIEEAKRWYYRAAAQNHPKARERLEDLKKGGQRMQKTRVSRSNVSKQNEGECMVM